ncbi:6-phospho-3-hexuloisomerase [Millisia brevis]|uniref:6-phospho-3-hexuloisomerase n=1 Tax=Millisia brevis TaxID=264148 RepID=UPI00082FB358|nr:6-phospho-3-hexuloisomerase [Millisia brevis]
MSATLDPTIAPHVRSHTELVLDEITRTVLAVRPDDLAAAADAIEGARRVFVLGLGRSGIALRALGMRLMHLGIEVHIVGETTTPALGDRDVLVLASGSGTTASIVRAATTAAAVGASTVVFTTDPTSPAARDARVVVVVPAAAKTDLASAASQQYAGSLFEQSVLVLGDALFHTLWRRTGAPAEELWARHANLE